MIAARSAQADQKTFEQLIQKIHGGASVDDLETIDFAEL